MFDPEVLKHVWAFYGLALEDEQGPVHLQFQVEDVLSCTGCDSGKPHKAMEKRCCNQSNNSPRDLRDVDNSVNLPSIRAHPRMSKPTAHRKWFSVYFNMPLDSDPINSFNDFVHYKF